MTIEQLKDAVEQNLKNDLALAACVFICTTDKIFAGDISQYLSTDNEKDEIIAKLSQLIHNHKAHKVLIVAEAWEYRAPDDMTKEQIEETIELGKHRYEFEKVEVYQIIEIAQGSVRMLTRQFSRSKNTVNFGKEILSEDVELVRFAPIQEALSHYTVH